MTVDGLDNLIACVARKQLVQNEAAQSDGSELGETCLNCNRTHTNLLESLDSSDQSLRTMSIPLISRTAVKVFSPGFSTTLRTAYCKPASTRGSG